MQNKSTKIISLLIMVLTVFMVYGVTNVLAAETKASNDKNIVTRAEWLSDLVDTFEMTVEDDNYPDNYFSDLQSSSEYYHKILVAVQFGVVDVEAGDPIYPDNPTTREFAASTLNFCLGYQMEKQNTTYTFSDSASVVDKDAAQVAVNHGWFALINGKFCPRNNVTSDEVTNMLADAKTIWNSTDVDQNYNNKYTLANGVIEIPEGTDVYLLDDGRIYIAECPKKISVGNSFVVHLNGIPCGYKAEKIEKDNSDYIITVSELSHEKAYKDADMQGTVDASALQIGEVADGLKVDYSERKGDTSNQGRARGSVNLDKYTTLKVGGDLKVGDQSVSVDVNVKNAKIDYAISLTGETFVKLRGDSDITCKCDLDAGKGMGLDEIPILPAQIPGVGGIDLIMEMSFGGKFNCKTSGYLVTGLSYSKANGFRIIKNFNAKSFTFTCEANASAGLKVRMGITGSALPIKGYVYSTAGGKAVFRHTTNTGSPKECTTVAAYIYAATGANASIKFGSLSASLSREVEIFGEDNSPLRTYHHYEDGKEVAKCSQGHDFKYYTNINSKYWGNGWSEGIGDYGYDANGNKVPLYTYTLDENNNATITGYKGNAAYLHIPETVDGYTVVGIGRTAFKGNRSIISISFPDSVTYIGDYAFAETALTELKLPPNLQIIKRSILEKNTGVKELIIPKTVTEMRTRTSWEDCGALAESGVETVIFEEGITSIPYRAMSSAKKLTKVVIPKTVTEINGNAMQYCESLEKVDLPENVTYIGEYAFAETALTELKLPPNLQIIKRSILEKNTGVKELIIPKTVTEMRTRTSWEDCGALAESGVETVIFEEGITSIPYRAMSSAKKLTKVVIPKTVTEINGNAMQYCESLEKVDLPENVTYIGEYAFAESGLKQIKLPNAITSIGIYTFSGCASLTDVTLSNNIEYIAARMFENCTSLTTITLPDSVMTINDNAFNGCTSLKNIQWGKSLTYIGEYAFTNCTSLTSLVIPDTVEKIENGTFCNDSSLEKIELSKALTQIDYRTFYNCAALTSIKIPDSVTYLGDQIFYNCDALTSIKIPNSVTDLGTEIFYDCDSLTDVKLGTGIKKIPNSAFEHCDKLASIVLPYRVESIGDNAFKNDIAFTEITIPRATTSIGSSAFSYFGKMTIYGISGTYAETYAKENGIKFVAKDVEATKITLDKTKLILNRGDRYTLKLSVEPEDFTDEVTWKSTNVNVATVDDDGVIYAKDIGSATIKVMVGEQSVKCTINVVQPVVRIDLNKGSISLDALEQYQLMASIYPDNAYNKDLEWKSEDETIATVSETGLVKAAKKGKTKIVVKAKDGSGTVTYCDVMVNNNAHVVKSVSEMESAHKYENNFSDFWIYTAAGMKTLNVTFDARTEVEDGFDYIYIYGADGTEVGKYTGKELSGVTIQVPGNTVKIKLVSDNSGNAWGFKVTRITGNGAQKPQVSVKKQNENLIATISNTDHVIEYGFIYGKQKDVTLDTPGRIRVAYSKRDSNGNYSFDTTKLTGCSIRAYVVYTDTAGNKQIIYSDLIAK